MLINGKKWLVQHLIQLNTGFMIFIVQELENILWQGFIKIFCLPNIHYIKISTCTP